MIEREKNYHALTCLPCARYYVLSALFILERWGNGVSERRNNLSKATEEIMGWGFGTGCRERVGWRRLRGQLQEKGCLKLWEERVVWEQCEGIGLKWEAVSQVSHGCFFVPLCVLSPQLEQFIDSSRYAGASQVDLVVKNLPANAGDARDVGSIPGSGRSPGGENGNPIQYSCLENTMDRGSWRATAHRVSRS